MTQADLMVSAQSEKVRTEAANSLLTHLKKPEVKQTDVKLVMEDSSGLREMTEALTNLAIKQKEIIDSGTMKTIDIAGTRLAIKDE